MKKEKIPSEALSLIDIWKESSHFSQEITKISEKQAQILANSIL